MDGIWRFLALLLLAPMMASAQPVDLEAAVNVAEINESMLAGVLGSTFDKYSDLEGGIGDGATLSIYGQTVSLIQRNYYYPRENESKAEFMDRANATYVAFISKDGWMSSTNKMMLIRIHRLSYGHDYAALYTYHILAANGNVSLRQVHAAIDESLFESFVNRAKVFGLE